MSGVGLPCSGTRIGIWTSLVDGLLPSILECLNRQRVQIDGTPSGFALWRLQRVARFQFLQRLPDGQHAFRQVDWCDAEPPVELHQIEFCGLALGGDGSTCLPGFGQSGGSEVTSSRLAVFAGLTSVGAVVQRPGHHGAATVAGPSGRGPAGGALIFNTARFSSVRWIWSGVDPTSPSARGFSDRRAPASGDRREEWRPGARV